jgi:hypothetical protein
MIISVHDMIDEASWHGCRRFDKKCEKVARIYKKLFKQYFRILHKSKSTIMRSKPSSTSVSLNNRLLAAVQEADFRPYELTQIYHNLAAEVLECYKNWNRINHSLSGLGCELFEQEFTALFKFNLPNPPQILEFRTPSKKDLASVKNFDCMRFWLQHVVENIATEDFPNGIFPHFFIANND